MYKRISVLLLALGHFGAQGQVNDNAVVIESAGLSITKAEFEQMLAGDPRLPVALARPAAKLALGTDFGKAFALEAEARRRQLDRDPAVQLKIRSYTQQLLANELLIKLRSGFLQDEAQLRAYYEINKEAYAQPRVRHILVRTKSSPVALIKGRPDLPLEQARAKAEALRLRLVNGADFAGLAKAESDDQGSLRTGGDLGFVAKGSTDANFEAAAYSLATGVLSTLIQTEFGFHILRVDERQPMPLAAVKAVIANDLAHKELDGIILNGYKLNTVYFGGP
ncbi:peptidylprolyl isomerase [Roseateles oligotrophus]|uniref:peptidylprolyl isomerase n=1 Tax=Roseateles oligotrophus TaxID=1769250 RepID=A0ABT2YF25_9BURK|nr:peptidylprolyl isomerase [Roseateles oligotrophus]MCV2368654.1 peptidylprolyl isomerase [Roseateles oligotrophus]